MLRPSRFPPIRCAALLLALGSALSAQEQPRTRPERDIVRERLPFNGQVTIYTRRTRLGVQVSPVAVETDSIGALVQGVTPNGPAAKAGLKAGDIITRLNGQALVEGDVRVGRGQSAPGLALSLIAATIDPGDTVVVQYQRGKERHNTTLVAGDDPAWGWKAPSVPFVEGFGDDLQMQEVAPEARMRAFRMTPPDGQFEMRTPVPRMFMFGSPLADLELAPLNPELGRYFGTGEGVLVINVPPDSHLGLKPGDVVFAVDGRKVRAPPQLFRVLESYEPGEEFKLDVMRMKKRETVTGSVAER
jgi:membrane-associated protease RseP (regulator of RpoE activity)